MDGNHLYGFIYDIQGTEFDITQTKMNIPLPERYVPILVQNGAPRSTQIPVPHDNSIDLSQQYKDEGPRYTTHENKPVSYLVTVIGETRVDN